MLAALKLKRYRGELHALRAHLDAQISQRADEVSDTADATLDRANQQTEVAINIGLATHEATIRKEVDDALERINAGTFATCEECHAPIDMHRLDTIPYARDRVRCERRIEQEGTP